MEGVDPETVSCIKAWKNSVNILKYYVCIILCSDDQIILRNIFFLHDSKKSKRDIFTLSVNNTIHYVTLFIFSTRRVNKIT